MNRLKQIKNNRLFLKLHRSINIEGGAEDEHEKHREIKPLSPTKVDSDETGTSASD